MESTEFARLISCAVDQIPASLASSKKRALCMMANARNFADLINMHERKAVIVLLAAGSDWIALDCPDSSMFESSAILSVRPELYHQKIENITIKGGFVGSTHKSVHHIAARPRTARKRRSFCAEQTRIWSAASAIQRAPAHGSHVSTFGSLRFGSHLIVSLFGRR